jgi:histone H3/H4
MHSLQPTKRSSLSRLHIYYTTAQESFRFIMDHATPTKIDAEVRSALQMAVIQSCSSNADDDSKQLTSAAVVALSELTFLFATTMLGPDLNAFRVHAGRRTITEADVKLVARNNTELLEQLTVFCDDHKQTDINGDGIQIKHASSRTSATVMIDLQSRRRKPKLPERHSSDSSSSSSSSCTMLDDNDKELPKQVPTTSKNSSHLMDTDDSDDDSQGLLDDAKGNLTNCKNRDLPETKGGVNTKTSRFFSLTALNSQLEQQGKRKNADAYNLSDSSENEFS